MRLLITWLWFNVAEILNFRLSLCACACYLYTLFMSFYLMFGIVRITLKLRQKFESQMVSTECCLSIKTKQIRNMILYRIYVHVNLRNPLVWKSLNCRKKEWRVPHIYISSGLHIKTFSAFAQFVKRCAVVYGECWMRARLQWKSIILNICSNNFDTIPAVQMQAILLLHSKFVFFTFGSA